MTAVTRSNNSLRLVLVVAGLAALLHMIPFWVIQSRSPADMTFTGNLSISPDHMQYRKWYRLSQETGLFVVNTFTTEPNSPHIPVPFYFLVGKIGGLLKVPPEFVYAYLGSILAFALVLVAYFLTRLFIGSTYQSLSVLLVIVFGGGLGGWIKSIGQAELVQKVPSFFRTLAGGLSGIDVFENFRGNYVSTALFDSHYLSIWLVSVSALVLLLLTLQKFTYARLCCAGLLYVITVLMHIYTGVTLLLVTILVLFLLHLKRLASKRVILSCVVLSCISGASILALVLLHRSSGLPFPTWREPIVLFSTVVLSYPLAWLVICSGFLGFWRQADLGRVFLVAWSLVCLVMLLSAPLYPYPTRGAMTFQIPLHIIAGVIYFSKFRRVSLPGIVICVALVGSTPVWKFMNKVDGGSIEPSRAPMIYLDSDHQAIIDRLKSRADSDSILIVDKSRKPRRTDDLWLAPDHPGNLYCGHFFLTVNYKRKCDEINWFFYQADAVEQASFLRDREIEFVFLRAKKLEKINLEGVEGLSLVLSNTAGGLFQFDPGLEFETPPNV